MLVFQQESGLPAADVILGLGCRGLNGRGKSWERKPDEWSTRWNSLQKPEANETSLYFWNLKLGSLFSGQKNHHREWSDRI